MGKGTACGEKTPTRNSHDLARAGGGEHRHEDPRTRGPELRVQGIQSPHHHVQCRRRWGIAVRLVDAQQVLLHRPAGRYVAITTPLVVVLLSTSWSGVAWASLNMRRPDPR